MTSKPLTIGHLAGAAGVGVETVRYYQRRRLLPLPERRGSSYRSYSEEQVDRIRFIKRAQELGFSLDEVGQLLRLHDGTDRESIRRIAADRLAEIGSRIADLERMRRVLEGLIVSCEHADHAQACPIPAIWLSKPIKRPLTEPFHRRSINPDVPVTVAAIFSARYYSSSRARELTQSPSLLRRILFREHHRSDSDLLRRGSSW